MNCNETIQKAYHEFKSLQEIETARTNVTLNYVDILSVYLSDEDDWSNDCQSIIEKFDLEEVYRETNAHHTLIYFARSEESERAKKAT